MTLERILRGVAQVVALAFLVTSNSVAQRDGNPALEASKSGERSRVPARKVGKKKVALNSGDAVRLSARSLDARCLQSEGGVRVPVARLMRVEGNVLVSSDSGLVAGEQGQALQEGARVWTTTGANVVIHYCDGCDVPVKANQQIEISLDEACVERSALVESILLDPVVVEGMAVAASGSMTAAVLAGVLPAATPLLGGVGLTGAIAAIRNREDEAVSPN
jgi:hypothetical protein